MAAPNWILIEDAIELIVDRHIVAMGSYVIESAYGDAWNECIDLLADGPLRSRPVDPADYWLTLSTDDGETEYPLIDPDGVIPPLFWHFYRRARVCQLQLSGYSIPGNGRQEIQSGYFGFIYSGDLKGNCTIEGFAGMVLVDRSALPGNLPRPPGRPEENDDAVIMQAIVSLRNGLSWNEVRRQAMPHMNGNSIDARRRRFARKMAAAGHPAPRSKKVRSQRT